MGEQAVHPRRPDLPFRGRGSRTELRPERSPDLCRASETPAEPAAPVPLPRVTAELRVSVDRHTVPTKNVVAMIEGSDPDLRNEYVIICAHHDHLGVINGDPIPGADDNISGVVAVIDIAEAYVAGRRGTARGRSARSSSPRGTPKSADCSGPGPTPSIPSSPWKGSVAVLNLDMIGRNEEIPAGDDWRFRGPRGPNGGIQCQRDERARPEPLPGPQGAARRGQRGLRPRHQGEARQ